MKLLSQIFKPLCLTLVSICFISHAHNGFGPSTKAELQSLVDSLNDLRENRKIEQAIELGESLLANESLKQHPELLIETHYLMASAYSPLAKIEKIKYHADEVVRLAEPREGHSWVLKATDRIAFGYFETSQYDSAQFYFEKCSAYAKAYAPERYPLTLSQLGWIYGLTDQEEKELNSYLELLHVVDGQPELDNNGGLRSKAYGALGDYYSRNSEYEKAKEYYEKKLQLAEENDNAMGRFEANLGLGSLYSHDEYFNLKKSEEAYLVPATDTANVLMVRLLGQLGLGSLYSKAKMYNESMAAFNRAYDVVRNTGAEDFLARIETEIANIHLEKNELAHADQWIGQALERTQRKNLTNRERNALRVRYKIDSANSNFRAAFNNYQRYRLIDDSLKTEDSKKRIEELQVKYETEQTENQNLVLKNDLALKEADLRQRAIIQTVFALVALLLAVLVYVIYRGDRRKKKLNKALEERNELISRQKEELQFKTDKLQIINSQLKALFDFRKDLTRMIAHDMKNPLNSIIGLSSTLKDDKKVSSITKSGYQLLNLVTNMLEVERMEEVKIDPKMERVCLDDLVKEAREQVELLVAAKSIVFKNLLPKKLCLQGDRHLLVRVLVNLLTNAIKYSESGDVIKIYHQHKEGMLGIVVEDQGIGISSERLPFIFDKFWQGEQRNSGLATSNGLGLTFCKLAIEALNGVISVHSELGEGTKVTFSLPYNGKPLETPEELANTSQRLVLESEKLQLEEYWSQLEQLKVYEVSRVKSLLKEIENQGIESKWKDELLKAVYQGDEVYFQFLISSIRPLENS